jgi:hypothetical protein
MIEINKVKKIIHLTSTLMIKIINVINLILIPIKLLDPQVNHILHPIITLNRPQQEKNIIKIIKKNRLAINIYSKMTTIPTNTSHWNTSLIWKKLMIKSNQPSTNSKMP